MWQLQKLYSTEQQERANNQIQRTRGELEHLVSRIVYPADLSRHRQSALNGKAKAADSECQESRPSLHQPPRDKTKRCTDQSDSHQSHAAQSVNPHSRHNIIKATCPDVVGEIF